MSSKFPGDADTTVWRARLEMDAPGLANLRNSIIPVCLITGLVLDTILANKN